VRAVADLNPVAQFAQTSENIELLLDEVRPYLMADGGNVALHEIDRNVVRAIRMLDVAGNNINDMEGLTWRVRSL
ncbi:hypothetical protein EJB05_28422, partial [Eragrostis curvula]